MPRSILTALLVPCLGMLLVRFPMVGDPAAFDTGWQAMVQFDWLSEARAGVDSVFTYGPFAYALTPTVLLFDGVDTRLALAYFVAFASAAALLSLAPRLPRGWRAIYEVSLLALAPFIEAGAPFLAIAAASIAALSALADSARDRSAVQRLLAWAQAAFAAAFAFLMGFAKFTFFMQAAGTMVLVVLALIAMRRRGDALRLAGLVACVFAAVWLALGQSLLDVPAWLTGSLEISRGYNECMAADDSAPARLSIAGVLIGLSVGLGVLLPVVCRQPTWCAADNMRRAGTAAIGMAGLFVAWKASFVRQDAGHEPAFFGYVTMLPLLLTAGGPSGPWPRWLHGAVASAVLVATGAYTEGGRLLMPGYNVGRLWLEAACHPAAVADLVRQALVAAHAHAPWPECRAIVGDTPVDLLGQQQGLLFTGGFAVRHRPVLQSYAACTPYLQRLDAAFFAAAEAPRFVLAELLPIPDYARPPRADDSAAWLAVLRDYRPLRCEAGVVLMERDPVDAVPAERVLERHVAFGERVELPGGDGLFTASIDVARTLWGDVVGALYRPGPMWLDLLTDAGPRTFRIAPLLVREPFLLDPLLDQPWHLLGLHLGAPPPRVLAFCLRVDAGTASHHRAGATVRIDRLAGVRRELDPAVAATLDLAQRRAIFRGFDIVPDSFSPATAFRPRVGLGEDGVLVLAPAEFSLRWPGGRRVLRAVVNGEADAGRAGVRFTIAVGDGVAGRVVYARTLQPAIEPRDRGEQEVSIELDLPRDDILTFGIGVAADGATVPLRGGWRALAVSPQ